MRQGTKAGTRVFDFEKKVFGTVTDARFHQVKWDNGITTLRGELRHLKADDPKVIIFTKGWKAFKVHMNER